MEIAQGRHGRGSVLITSQLPVASWHEAHTSRRDTGPHRPQRLRLLDGPSMRKLKAGNSTEPPATSAVSTASDGKPAKGARKMGPTPRTPDRQERSASRRKPNMRAGMEVATRRENDISCRYDDLTSPKRSECCAFRPMTAYLFGSASSFATSRQVRAAIKNVSFTSGS